MHLRIICEFEYILSLLQLPCFYNVGVYWLWALWLGNRFFILTFLCSVLVGGMFAIDSSGEALWKMHNSGVCNYLFSSPPFLLVKCNHFQGWNILVFSYIVLTCLWFWSLSLQNLSCHGRYAFKCYILFFKLGIKNLFLSFIFVDHLTKSKPIWKLRHLTYYMGDLNDCPCRHSLMGYIYIFFYF